MALTEWIAPRPTLLNYGTVLLKRLLAYFLTQRGLLLQAEIDRGWNVKDILISSGLISLCVLYFLPANCQADSQTKQVQYVSLVEKQVSHIMDEKELAAYPINVVLLFEIDKHGRIAKWSFITESNFAAVNKYFTDRISKLRPFQAPPREFPNGLRIQVTASRNSMEYKTPPYFKCKSLEEQTYSVSPLGEPIEHKILQKEGTLADYRAWFENCDDCPVNIKLFRKRKLLLKKELPRWQGLCEPHYAFVDPLGNITTNEIPVARDLDYDGKPELVIQEISEAGGHPAERLQIFKLDGTDVLKCTFDQKVIEPEFTDIDKDKRFELLIKDDAFAMWLDSSDADSIYPEIVLDSKTYKPSAKFTRYKPTSAENFNLYVLQAEVEISKYQKATNYRVMIPFVWRDLIKLVYQGNADTAKRILEKLYPGKTKLLIVTSGANEKLPSSQKEISKEQFWNMLYGQAKKSKYFQQLSALNQSFSTPPH